MFAWTGSGHAQPADRQVESICSTRRVRPHLTRPKNGAGGTERHGPDSTKRERTGVTESSATAGENGARGATWAGSPKGEHRGQNAPDLARPARNVTFSRCHR